MAEKNALVEALSCQLVHMVTSKASLRTSHDKPENACMPASKDYGKTDCRMLQEEADGELLLTWCEMRVLEGRGLKQD